MLRRTVLKGIAATVAGGAIARPAIAQQPVLKIGMSLPMTGAGFNAVGRQLKASIQLFMQQNGDTVGGRKIELTMRDDGGVADGQGVTHVVDEFDRARSVEEGEPVAEVIDAGDIGLDAHGVAARLRARIADAGAFAHRALPRHAAAARQDPLEKAGFAALKRSDDRDQTGARDAIFVIGCVQYRPPSSVAPRREAPRASHCKAIHSLDPNASLRTRFSQL